MINDAGHVMKERETEKGSHHALDCEHFEPKLYDANWHSPLRLMWVAYQWKNFNTSADGILFFTLRVTHSFQKLNVDTKGPRDCHKKMTNLNLTNFRYLGALGTFHTTMFRLHQKPFFK